MSKVAVVTGGTGFIGWNLCEALRDGGWTVRAIVRPTSANPLPDGIERVDAPLDAERMRAGFAGTQVVYHLAGLTRATSYERFLRVNAAGAEQVALAARAADAFMVLVSSMAASGPGKVAAPSRESDPARPINEYGRSKLEGERAVAAVDGLRWSIVRPPGVYGPRDDDFLALFRLGRRGLFPLLGPRDTAYTLVHVQDAVRALRAVARAGLSDESSVRGETFFIGHPQPVRSDELPEIIGAALDRPVRCVPVPRLLLRALAEGGELFGRLTGTPALLNRSRYHELTAPGFVCDVAKIEARLGHRARLDARAGFAATAEWYAEHGLL